MATAEVNLIDPALSVLMKIEAADGLIPALAAHWRTQKNPRTGVAYGFLEDGSPVAEDEEVVRRFWGQLYLVEVRDMMEARAQAKAALAAQSTYEAEKAKFPPLDYVKIV